MLFDILKKKGKRVVIYSEAVGCGYFIQNYVAVNVYLLIRIVNGVNHSLGSAAAV